VLRNPRSAQFACDELARCEALFHGAPGRFLVDNTHGWT
jgi:hypothetical protein